MTRSTTAVAALGLFLTTAFLTHAQTLSNNPDSPDGHATKRKLPYTMISQAEMFKPLTSQDQFPTKKQNRVKTTLVALGFENMISITPEFPLADPRLTVKTTRAVTTPISLSHPSSMDDDFIRGWFSKYRDPSLYR